MSCTFCIYVHYTFVTVYTLVISKGVFISGRAKSLSLCPGIEVLESDRSWR